MHCDTLHNNFSRALHVQHISSCVLHDWIIGLHQTFIINIFPLLTFKRELGIFIINDFLKLPAYIGSCGARLMTGYQFKKPFDNKKILGLQVIEKSFF